MEFEFKKGEKTHKLSVEKENGQYKAKIEDRNFKVDYYQNSPYCFSLLIGNKVYTVYIAENAEEKYVFLKGFSYRFKEHVQEDRAKHASTDGGFISDGLISTPMPGKIVKVLVKEGDEVEEGQSLLILESMKMENDIASPFKGKVIKINIQTGDLAQPGESLIDLERI